MPIQAQLGGGIVSNLTDSLAFNLKRLRKEKGIKTQELLSEVSEVDINIIKRAEAGHHVPETKNLVKIAKALGAEETDLFLDPTSIREPSLHEAVGVLLSALESKIGHYAPASQSKARAARPESELPYEEEKLLEKIRKLTSAQKQSLDRMADQLLAKNAQKSRKDSKETAG